jgi:hypothetical protein
MLTDQTVVPRSWQTAGPITLASDTLPEALKIGTGATSGLQLSRQLRRSMMGETRNVSVSAAQGGGQGRGRTVDPPIFSSKSTQ